MGAGAGSATNQLFGQPQATRRNTSGGIGSTLGQTVEDVAQTAAVNRLNRPLMRRYQGGIAGGLGAAGSRGIAQSSALTPREQQARAFGYQGPFGSGGYRDWWLDLGSGQQQQLKQQHPISQFNQPSGHVGYSYGSGAGNYAPVQGFAGFGNPSMRGEFQNFGYQDMLTPQQNIAHLREQEGRFLDQLGGLRDQVADLESQLGQLENRPGLPQGGGGIGPGGPGPGGGGPGTGVGGGTPGGVGGNAGGPSGAGGAAGGGTAGKIICTAMYNAHGFGNYRQRLWMSYGDKFLKHPRWQLGYHKLFAPLVKRRKRWPKIWNMVERLARDHTVNMRRTMRGQSTPLNYKLRRAAVRGAMFVLGSLVHAGILKEVRLDDLDLQK